MGKKRRLNHKGKFFSPQEGEGIGNTCISFEHEHIPHKMKSTQSRVSCCQEKSFSLSSAYAAAVTKDICEPQTWTKPCLPRTALHSQGQDHILDGNPSFELVALTSTLSLDRLERTYPSAKGRCQQCQGHCKSQQMGTQDPRAEASTGLWQNQPPQGTKPFRIRR